MKKLKFILIDDNEAYRNTLKRVLISKYNAEIVTEAASAEEFFQTWNKSHADIILMDVMMPGKSGIELTKELHRDYSMYFKIIAITMHADKVYLKTLVEAGFRGCIFKDDLIKQLDDAITTVCNGKLFFPENILIESFKDNPNS